MTEADYRDALRLLDSALVLLDPRRCIPRSFARVRLRTLVREVHLLRARLGQPTPLLQRN